MKKFAAIAALGAAMIVSQPAVAAVVTVAFTGIIGPFTTPATLSGGAFDGTLRYDNSAPFPTSAATLTVTNGPLANTYLFGAAPGAFLASAYRTTSTNNAFTFQGTSDDGASLTFNLTGNNTGSYSGTFSFAKGSEFAATGNAAISAATAVPEPASWLVLIAGFGAIGATIRVSRKPTSWVGSQRI